MVMPRRDAHADIETLKENGRPVRSLFLPGRKRILPARIQRPQPAVRQLPHPPGRARGPCPTKILRITPGGQGRPPLRRNVLQGGTHVSRRTPHPLQKTLSLAWRSTSHGLQLPAAAPAIRAPDRGMQQLMFLYRKQIFDAAGARPAHPFIVKKPTGLFVS